MEQKKKKKYSVVLYSDDRERWIIKREVESRYNKCRRIFSFSFFKKPLSFRSDRSNYGSPYFSSYSRDVKHDPTDGMRVATTSKVNYSTRLKTQLSNYRPSLSRFPINIMRVEFRRRHLSKRLNEMSRYTRVKKKIDTTVMKWISFIFCRVMKGGK